MKKLLIAVLCIFAMLMTVACGKDNSAKQHEGINIVTSFYPMYIATLNVADGVEGVHIVNMTKPQTGCLHDYQLTTEDMKLLETADILVTNGGGMEAFIDKVIKQEPNMKIVNASEGIEMINDDEGENPHVWVSVSNAILQTNNIVKQLSEIDPKHKEQYEKNGAEYVKKLEALKTEMHAKLDNYAGKEIVTFHEAFPYFAKEFNLKIAAVIDREPGTEPTPTELEETIEIIQKAGIKAVFTEPQYSPGAANTISSTAGVKIYTLDPVVTGEANDGAKDAYIETMKKNADTLVKALQ